MLPPDDFNPEIGVAEVMEPGLRRITSPNPSPMTYRGTNTYLIGTRGLAVIDPGPDNADHLRAILAAVGPDQHISHILVTHSHLDHSPLARPLARRCGAPVLAFGGADAGRSDVMHSLVAGGLIGGGEGIDIGFEPDQTLSDGQVIDGEDWTLNTIHTPGHLGNHLCLAWGDACLTADHVMGWASSLVSPPDGDLTDFMASCAKLQTRDWRVFYPGHGAPILDPAARLAWLVGHRKTRESAIIAHLGRGPHTAQGLTSLIYTDTPPTLREAAARNVLAHLIDLYGRSIVTPGGSLNAKATFHLS
ncbi:MAG: MBL fold metallo-hydrolase [Sulfitobacter sp.]